MSSHIRDLHESIGIAVPVYRGQKRQREGTLGENPRDLEHEDGIVWTEGIEQSVMFGTPVELSVSTRRPVPWRGNGRRVQQACGHRCRWRGTEVGCGLLDPSEERKLPGKLRHDIPWWRAEESIIFGRAIAQRLQIRVAFVPPDDGARSRIATNHRQLA